MLKIFSFILFIGISQFAFAQGTAIVRIPDDITGRRIDRSKDAIDIDLIRAFVHRTTQLIGSDDKAIGVTVKLILKGRDNNNAETETVDEVSHEYMRQIDVTSYPGTRNSLPLEFSALNFYRLHYPTYEITNAELLIDIVKTKQPSGFGVALQTIAKFSDKFQIPIPPFQQIIKTVGDFTADLADQNGDKSNGVDVRIPFSNVNLIFDPNSTDAGTMTDKTGAFALLMSDGDKNDDGYIPIGHENNYELKVEPLPSRQLECRPKGTSNDFVVVANDYILFALNAHDISGQKQTPTLDNTGSAKSIRSDLLMLSEDSLKQIVEGLSSSKNLKNTKKGMAQRDEAEYYARIKQNFWKPEAFLKNKQNSAKPGYNKLRKKKEINN